MNGRSQIPSEIGGTTTSNDVTGTRLGNKIGSDVSVMSDFLMNVRAGKFETITGTTIEIIDIVAKIQNHTTGASDVWDVGGTIIYDTASSRLTVRSSSMDDTSTGTGIGKIIVDGLSSSFLETNNTANLNGTNLVTLATAMTRVNDFYGGSAGTSLVAAGDVTLYPNVATITGVNPIAQIRAGEGRHSNSHFSVPESSTAYLLSWEYSGGQVAAPSVVSLVWGDNQFPEPFKAVKRGYANGTPGGGPGHFFKFKERADIKVIVTGETTTPSVITVNYSLLVIKNL